MPQALGFDEHFANGEDLQRAIVRKTIASLRSGERMRTRSSVRVSEQIPAPEHTLFAMANRFMGNGNDSAWSISMDPETGESVSRLLANSW